MKSQHVSILMPAYNGEAFINQAVESVQMQEYPKWELIIIDDGSTDKTAEIVRSYKDPRIIYRYQDNQGQAAALNAGLKIAQGEYITTLDVDDWLTPDSLSARVAFLESNPDHGVVYGDGYYCNAQGDLLILFSENRFNDVSGDVFDVLISFPFYGTGANVMVRKQIFDEHNIRYDESIIWCQDYDIYIRIAQVASFGLIETPTVWYRLHETNMTMVMPKSVRLDSLIRTRYKVLASPRFKLSTAYAKIPFFMHLLVYELYGELDQQLAVAEHRQFKTLCEQDQAMLLRRAALQYLFVEDNIEAAKMLIGRALSSTAFDRKTLAVYGLTRINSTFSKVIVKWWRKYKPDYTAPLDVFSLVNNR